ncbi:hypothetical protein SAMN05518865_1457, partial [Duganella sp. CF458]
MSATQASFGRVGRNVWFNKFGATGMSCPELV